MESMLKNAFLFVPAMWPELGRPSRDSKSFLWISQR